VPLVLITGFILARNEYYRKIAKLSEEALTGLQPYTQEEILQLAASGPIAIFYIAWFVIFYFLAIKNRKKSPRHARYMLATALTLTGPTVDRILGIHFGWESIAGISSYIVSFLIIDFILGVLLYLDYKNKRDTKALYTCLLVYFVGQILYFILPHFDAWGVCMKFIMLLKP
jgi:D-alanyl-lipoteichoic acid acyltransferase DltB (MBOAT superfamily)